MSRDLVGDLSTHLLSKGLHASQQWLATFTLGPRPNIPFPALRQTCLFRVLQSDITLTLAPPPAGVFPSDILNARVQERRIVGPIVAQVLDIEDIGSSKWSQVEAIEAQERGEMTKGREIIRVVPGEVDPNGNEAQAQSSGPHKLLLQDAKGMKVYALELRNVDGINTNMNIGSKLVLKNFTVARGVILLEPANVSLLGGKIDALNKAWREGRKERLKAAATANNPTNAS